MSEGKIVVEGLCKSFEGERVVDGVVLYILHGCSLVLLGVSGSGQTLTLKCGVGLVRPDSGRIRIDGQGPRSSTEQLGAG